MTELVEGRRYKIRHIIEGVQRYDRESVLVYLGTTEGVPQFSGRDFARGVSVCGTTTVSTIKEIERVADDAPLYVNRRAPANEKDRLAKTPYKTEAERAAAEASWEDATRRRNL